MCGRYLITSAPEALRALFRYLDQPNFPPRYNVAPTQPVPIVRMWEGERRFALVRWGFVPAWARDPREFSLLFNARGDTAAEKPAFRNAMVRRRCLFPADGFYEWQADGSRKRPFAVLPKDGKPVAFAGVWEAWIGPNGEEVETAAILTTDANATLRHIHSRMPAILPPEAFADWLDCAGVDARAATRLLVPAPDDLLVAYEVSTAVNRAANDSPDLLAPVTHAAPVERHQAADHAAPTQRPARARAKVDSGQGSLF